VAFRALRSTGLALSLGLTALAAYQGIRDAMAEAPTRSGGGGGGRHLDATGPREVVYCHQCDNEWYNDEHGLVCPRCEGEITEIVSVPRHSTDDLLTSSQIEPGESDPRPGIIERPPTPPGFRSLQHHNPWGDSDVSDPEEADIEEHITHGPGGSVMFSQTIRHSTPRGTFRNRQRRDPMPDDPDNVMRDFQSMIGNLMGPGFRPGQAGRSGPDTLFTQGPFGGGFRMRGEAAGPQVVGGRFTFTTTGGRLRPRDADGPQPGEPPVGDLATYASPFTPPSPNGRPILVVSIRASPDQLARILGGLFGPMGPMGQAGHAGDDGPQGAHGMPMGLQSLFAAMLNPANARSGDAVYSQEALDQIISTLMEQHPTSNAPGPASADAIAALPKKKVDEKLLGPEGKAECSVCMDDVHIGDEVVVLPCTHWFHETCASAWLSEHNTCPICRNGIDSGEEQTPLSNSRRSSNSGTPRSRNEHRARRSSATRPRNRESPTQNRNEARLDAIRNSGHLTPTEGNQGPIRWQVVGSGDGRSPSARDGDSFGRMPGSFHRRASGVSDMSDNQRDGRRGYTSGSDRSREGRDSRRNSRSETGGNAGGPMSWLRDRLGSNRRNE
jgi:E3 ubiquitin-protein ligase RNF115/126